MHSDPYVQYVCRYALTAGADDEFVVHPSATGDSCLTTVRNGTYDKTSIFPPPHVLSTGRSKRPASPINVQVRLPVESEVSRRA